MGVTIQLSDEQAAVLKAKAAAQGLTLEGWLGKLAAVDTPSSRSRPRKGRYKLSELMEQCDPKALLSREDLAWTDSPDFDRIEDLQSFR